MGKHLQKLFSFRTDEELIKKIEYIAKSNTRNRTQQIEHLLKQCINNFENINGKLLIDDNGNVSPSINKLDYCIEKSSTSKIG